MPTKTPRILLEIRYYEAAQEYLRSLPPEHFMEATPQATQRKITLESLDLVHARRPEVQVFNELLVQYPLVGKKKLGQVVPDNMVVVHSEPIDAEGSYDVPLQAARPFWVVEYVSKSNRRKDYDDNMRKYEYELKVPYYMLFVPDEQELTLYRLKAGRYSSVRPNKFGRYPIQPLDLSIAILDGWVRYWYQEELLPLPGELQQSLDEARARVVASDRRAEEQTRLAEEQRRRAEEQTRLAEEQRRRAEEQTSLAQNQTLRAETAEREMEKLLIQIAELQSRQSGRE